MSNTPTTEINQETDLIGTVTSNIAGNSTQCTATFIDKKTGIQKAPQSTTLEYTIDQDNSSSETILMSSVTTDINGITTLVFATNGRNIPKFGTGAGTATTSYTHVIGAAVGCVDIARPLNLLAQIANEKGNLTGGNNWTGTQNVDGPIIIADSATNYLRIPKLTTVQRLALPLVNGTEVYDTDTGNWYKVEGGAWSTFASGAVPNAAPGTAGKVETGTIAQQITHTSVGASGALLVPQIGNLTTTSAGAADAGKIPILNASGQIDSTLIAANFVLKSSYTTKGDILAATAASTTAAVTVGSNEQILIADSTQTTGVAWASRIYKPLAATRIGDAANGVQTIAHGCGKTPKNVKITATKGFAGPGITNSWGSFNGTNTVAISSYFNGVPGFGDDQSTTNIIIINDTGADFQKATIAIDTTNITLTWTKTGSPSNSDILMLIECEA